MSTATRRMSSLLPNPVAGVRKRFRAWWQQRLPRTDTLLLTQRNVYILPTRAGLMFGVTLVVLLLASINYQLSLGYVLTFLLAGSGVVSMHVTHNTLRGLTLHLRPPGAVFAGTPALLDITLTSPGAARFGIGLRMESTPAATLSWTDVPQGGQAHAQMSFVPQVRGRYQVPALSAETRSAGPVPRLVGVAARGAGAGLPATRTTRRGTAAGACHARRPHGKAQCRWRRGRRHSRLPARRPVEAGGLEESRTQPGDRR